MIAGFVADEKPYPISDIWRAKVQARLTEMGMSRAELAKIVGCSAPTITTILSGSQDSSDLVPKIHKALQWPAPANPEDSLDIPDDEVDLKKLYQALPESLRPRALKQIRELFEIAEEVKRDH